MSLSRCALPQTDLGSRQRFPLAGRTKRLPVTGWSPDAVIESQPRQNVIAEIFDVHERSEAQPAAGTQSGLRGVAGLVIELDAELSRALENMKELSKREI